MQIQYDNQIIEMNDEFSFNKGRAKDIPNGINVYATVFSQEKPDTKVFRPDMKDVTFYNCNLDNCLIPDGNIVIGGSQRRFEAQNDLNDWIVDENNEPIKPLGFEIFEKLDLPIPKLEDIPNKKVKELIDLIELAKQ